jgi:hypothetical protein
VADEADSPATPTAPSDDLAPPRELVTLLAAGLALACAALVVVGGRNKWTSPTLGVLLILGGAESLAAIGLVVRCALAEQRKKGPFVASIVVTALASLSLAAVLLLSGII